MEKMKSIGTICSLYMTTLVLGTEVCMSNHAPQVPTVGDLKKVYGNIYRKTHLSSGRGKVEIIGMTESTIDSIVTSLAKELKLQGKRELMDLANTTPLTRHGAVLFLDLQKVAQGL